MSVDKDHQQVMKKNHLEEENESLANEVMNGGEKRVLGNPHDNAEPFRPHETKDAEGELGRKLQEALRVHNWELAESFITGSNMHILNDALCMSLDSIWFLNTCHELNGLTTLIKKIISNGASDFTWAALRTSVIIPGGGGFGLYERLEECNGTEFLMKEASDKVLKFTEWALKCIIMHLGNNDGKMQITLSGVQFQLSAFRTFLDLAENWLTIRDFTEAFDAACFPLTLYSCSFDPGWASGTSAGAIQGLLNIFADRGADNVNQCILEAARFGSAEVVRMLLQIARWNSLPVDVNLVLVLIYASYYSKFGTMECLVDEGQASSFLDPLMEAAERGCIPVITWFVGRGCTDMDLCIALTSAASSNQLAAATYLLPRVPHHMLTTFSVDILKTIAELSGGFLDGVAFLLSFDFLGSQDATYSVADSIVSGSNNEAVMPELVDFLSEDWSSGAFYEGLREEEEHYVKVIRVLRNGCSEIRMRELPTGLVIAIALMPLYRECLKAKGRLLTQRLRGELVGAVRRLGYEEAGEGSRKEELMAVLERHLPSFLIQS